MRIGNNLRYVPFKLVHHKLVQHNRLPAGDKSRSYHVREWRAGFRSSKMHAERRTHIGSQSSPNCRVAYISRVSLCILSSADNRSIKFAMADTVIREVGGMC